MELDGEQGPISLGGAKERRLLAALALHAGTVVPGSALVDALWADRPPRTAEKTLQNYVLRVRRSLRRCEGFTVTTRPPGYQLDAAPGVIDACAVEDLIGRGTQARLAGDEAGAVRLLRTALAYWRGPSLGEFASEPFARSEAARLEELRAAAEEDLVAAELALGRHHELIGRLESMVATLPLRERRWALLMVALYREDRQAEALAAYRRVSLVLREELGVTPGAELQRIHAAVLHHDDAVLRLGREPAGRSSSGSSPSRIPCFGRDAELSRLLGRTDDAAAGDGGVLLVSGEAGIGKTRLLGELGDSAGRRGMTVFSGRCLEGPGSVPFQPFVEALDAHLVGLPDDDLPKALDALAPLAGLLPRWPGRRTDAPVPVLAPDERRLRLLDTVLRFLCAPGSTTAVVVLLDDLHWADDGTVAMLRHVARATRHHRLLVVGAYRPDEVPDEHPLTDVLGELPGMCDYARVRLRGLDPAALELLLRATAGRPLAPELVAVIARETDGNPFFARELIHHLLEEDALLPGAAGELQAPTLTSVPESVRQVIARRRRRLPPGANRLLEAAALNDGPFPLVPVAAVAGLDDPSALAALDALLAAGLVTAEPAPDRYDFGHALIRHTVYLELNPSRRLRLHRALAEALAAARSAGQGVAAAEVAVQYHRSAGLPGAAAGVPSAVEAAQQTRAAGAHAEDAAFCRMALDLADTADPVRADLLSDLARAEAWSLRFDESVTVGTAALESLAIRDGPDVAVRFAADLAATLAAAGSNRHAWSVAAGALSRASPTGPDPDSWAVLYLLDLDRQEAADPGNPGIALDLPQRRRALGVLLRSGRLAQRGDLSRYAVAAVHGRRDQIPPEDAADPTVALFLTGDLATAVAGFERAAAEAAKRGQLAWEVYSRACAARGLAALGRLRSAATVLEHTRSLAARIPGDRLSWQLIHHVGAEDAYAMAIDEGWTQQVAMMQRLLRPDVPEHRWGIAAIHGITARCYARLGQRADALPLLARPVRALRMAPAWAPNFGRMACDVAETLWLLDRRDHLAVVEEALRGKVLPADFRFPMTDARQALARLCALDGRPDEAIRWFQAAREVLLAQGARPLAAVVDFDEAAMHLRGGDRTAAIPLVTAARTSFIALGMTGWTRRIDALVRR